MTYEQVTLDDIFHPNYSIEPQSKSGIYPKIDWLTFMFERCSVNEILSFLKIDDYVQAFMNSMYSRSGMQEQFVFVYNYIRIEVNQFYFYNLPEDYPVFDVKCSTIRVDLSGQALDYLRSVGFDFYELRSHSFDLDFHISRCDWAFDLVDYKPDFLDKLIDHVNTHALPSGRVPLISTHGAVKCSMKLIDQRTVYFGSGKSDKLLRVYDKRMQYQDANGLWKVQIPYENPSSWIRIELQTRNQNAHGLLMPGVDGQTRDYLDILKYIFNHYQFADGTVDGNNVKRQLVDFWETLFPWDDVKSKIIQNAKYVLPVDYETKLKRYVESICLPKVIEYIHAFGVEQFARVASDYIHRLDPSMDDIDPSARKRRDALYSHLIQLGVPVPTDSSDANGLVNLCGKLIWIYPRLKGDFGNA